MLIHSLTILLTLTVCSAIQPFYANSSVASRTMTFQETTPTPTHSYTALTLTSCSANRCTVIPTREIVSTFSSESEGTTKVFTTHHPIPETTLVTITSCSRDVCSTKSSLAIVSTYSGTDSRGETTVYSTYCPIESKVATPSSFTSPSFTAFKVSAFSSADVSSVVRVGSSRTSSTTSTSAEVQQTTLVVVTSCSNRRCSATTSPALVSTFSGTNSHGVSTVYTTYCPLTQSGGESVSLKTTSSEAESRTESFSSARTHSLSSSRISATITTSATSTSSKDARQSTSDASTSGTPPRSSIISESLITTHIDVTSCSHNVCFTTPSPAIVSTFSGTDSKGESTIYTTYCPITSKASTGSSRSVSRMVDVPMSSSIPAEETTHVTITSCSNNICSATSSPAIVSTFSGTDSHGVSTVYTTYCPISDSSKSASSSEETSSSKSANAKPSSTQNTKKITSDKQMSSSTSKVPVTTHVATTLCSDDICITTSSPAIVSTMTTTDLKGLSTVYTTYCPLSESESEQSSTIGKSSIVEAISTISSAIVEKEIPQTTHVTLTSCSNNICSTTSSPAIVSTYSSTDSRGVSTVYTTYCPVTSSSEKSSTGQSATVTSSTLRSITTSSSKSITTSSSKSTVMSSLGSVTTSSSESTVMSSLRGTTMSFTSSTTAISSETSSSIIGSSPLETTQIATTSCSKGECSTYSTPAIVSIYSTTDSRGIVTVSTTLCPISKTESLINTNSEVSTTEMSHSESVIQTFKTWITETSSPAKTTHVKVTSCVDGGCFTTSAPALESTFTSTNSQGVSTVYTTYCPITSQTISPGVEDSSCSGTMCGDATEEPNIPLSTMMSVAEATGQAESINEASMNEVSTVEVFTTSEPISTIIKDTEISSMETLCSGTLCPTASSLSSQFSAMPVGSGDQTTTIVLSTRITQTRQSTGAPWISTYQGAASRQKTSFLMTVLCGLVYII